LILSSIELSEEQLASARTKAWHQDGEAVLTLEAAREWVGGLGLVLFAPRPQFPLAGSLVEATLGATSANPTAAALETARGLLARMVAEGTALPLNLLGGATETPDFVVSAQVFSYVFTLRGDKAWKQAPSTSGAVKVSPLGLRVFEVLTERGALTAAELANELGREVTEVAIVRALAELWAQMRVLPLAQQGEESTLWELTTRRFTKAIKSGANAGLPTAMSALVSLYLAQAVAATEDDIATYLSPLTARSRVREVLNALTGARQLETIVVDGKTLVHLPGGLPVAVEAAVEGEAVEVESVAAAAIPAPKKVGTGRIRSFDAGKPEDLRGKPVKKFAAKPAFGAKPGGKFGAKPGGKFAGAKSGGFKPTKRVAGAEAPDERERRPFSKAAVEAPSFTKPWDEENKPKA
jgi:23S rRNA pseudouridine2605 synthase